MTQTVLDQVTLVTSSDEVVGSMDKVAAHRGNAQLHRAISVYLFRQGTAGTELLIQQRSAEKIVGAGQWANTCCGNVRPSETYQECAHRRLQEELGITQVKLFPVTKFEYHLQCNLEFSEWEMDQVYVGWYDGPVLPNPAEVQDYRWVDWEELESNAEHAGLKTSEFNSKKIEITTNEPINQSAKQLTLAPWFVYMLAEKKIITEINKRIGGQSQ